jgi:predicted Zn-dependent protease
MMAQAAIESRRGRVAEGVVIYQAVLERLPEFAPAQKRLALLYANQPAELARAYDLGMKARKVLSDDNELTQALAVICFKRKEYPRTIQLLQESSRGGALDAKLQYYLGMSYLKTGQKTRAAENLKLALAAGLDEPSALEAKRAMTELERD